MASGVSELRRFMPFTLPTRTGATLFFHLPVEVEATTRWLETKEGQGYRFFHVFCAAIVRTLAERPQLNRFVLDGTLYQRDRVTIAFAVKKGFRDDTELRMVKVELSAGDTLAGLRDRVDAAILAARSPEPTVLERELAFLNRLPRWLTRGLLALAGALDRRGLLPGPLLEQDPTHAGALVTNLGSIGLDASFHHLSDHGSASLVVALGCVRLRPHVAKDGSLVAAPVADIKLALDDRIVDGFYCARSLARFEHHLRHPRALLQAMGSSSDTIPGRLFERARGAPEQPAYFTRTGGTWAATTWFTYAEEVRSVGQALITLGVGRGDRVCLKVYNRPEWAVFHLAAMAVGAIPTSVHDDAAPGELVHVLSDARPSVVLVEDAAAAALVAQTLGPDARVVLTRDATAPEAAGAISWSDLVELGREADDGEVGRRLAALGPSDPAVIIYTSGTTGSSRGAVLTHENLSWTARAAASMFGGSDADRTVSYLPLSHVAEQMFTVYVPVTTGGAVYFAPTRHGLFDTLREVQPTAVFGVPRVWRKLVSEALAVLEDLGTTRGRWVVRRAVDAATAFVEAEERGAVTLGQRVRYAWARRTVLDEARRRLGLAETRHAITGAAAIDPETVLALRGLGLSLRETYGQTEGSGPTTFNVPGRTRLGTVGAAFPGVEVRVEDGEILVRGPNVFSGYWRRAEATRAALRDGWLVTGDQGALDADGFLHLTGRSKELLVTAGGEKVAPAPLEASLESLGLVEQAVIVGEARPYLTALICLDVDAAVRLLESRGGAPTGPLHADPRVEQALQAQIDGWNRERSPHERLRRFHLLAEPLTAEEGDLTATLTLRREAIARRHGPAIESMYGARPVSAPPRADPSVSLGGFVARLAVSPDEIDEVYALRYRAFRDAGHLDLARWPEERLHDEFDRHALQFVVRDLADELVGTVRLVLPAAGLPVQHLFRFAPLPEPAERVGEIGRLAVDPRWRNRRGPLRALIQAILRRGAESGLSHYYAFVPFSSVRGYRALGYTTWEIPCEAPTDEMLERRRAMGPYFATQDPRVIVFAHGAEGGAC